MTAAEIEEMYRLLAIARYEDRYVIPPAHREVAARLEGHDGGCPVGQHGYPELEFTPAPTLSPNAHFMLGQPPGGQLPPVRRTADGFAGGLLLKVRGSTGDAQ